MATHRTLLASATASSDNSIEFTGVMDGTYDIYELIAYDVVPSIDDASFFLQVSDDDGATWKAGASDYHTVSRQYDEDNAGDIFNTTAAVIQLYRDAFLFRVGNTTSESWNTKILFYCAADTTKTKNMLIETFYSNSSDEVLTQWGMGQYDATGAYNAVRLLVGASETFTVGEFRFYGVR